MKSGINVDLKQNWYLCGGAAVLVFFALLHLSFVGLFSDDLWFLDMINEANSLPELLMERYQTWTGRLILETVCFGLVKAPFFVWCIIDVLLCVLLYHSLTVVFVNDHGSVGNLWLAALMACYPFMHMASAGWISTSLNYLWPFALASYVIATQIRAIRGEKPGMREYILSVAAFIYAANSELCAVYTILCITGCVVYKRLVHSERKAVDAFEAVILIIAVAEMAFAFSAPGNALRSEIEVRWMPEFPELSLFRKGMLCGIFVFEHFVAIPDVIFFFFAVMLLIAGYGKERKLWQKAVAALPLLTDIVFTSYYFVKDFIIGKKREYDYSYPTVYPGERSEVILQILELAGLIIFLAASIVTLFIIFDDMKRRFVSLWFLGSAFAVRMSLMLSATMFSSWHRTLIYLYFAMICVSCMMLDDIRKREKNPAWIRILCIFTIVCGIGVNLFLTVGHQLRRR